MTLAGCACSSDPVTETAYAAMASFPAQLTTCIVQRDCAPLCRAVFQIGDAEIERCELVAFDGYDPVASTGRPVTADDLKPLRGATVRVTYVVDACSGGDSVGDTGYDGSAGAGSTDDGSADDGSADDGSDDGSADDGSDDGSADDGSDDGSTDDGSTDDGSTDDGSTDDGDDSPRRPPPPGAWHVTHPATRG